MVFKSMVAIIHQLLQWAPDLGVPFQVCLAMQQGKPKRHWGGSGGTGQCAGIRAPQAGPKFYRMGKPSLERNYYPACLNWGLEQYAEP